MRTFYLLYNHIFSSVSSDSSTLSHFSNKRVTILSSLSKGAFTCHQSKAPLSTMHLHILSVISVIKEL